MDLRSKPSTTEDMSKMSEQDMAIADSAVQSEIQEYISVR